MFRNCLLSRSSACILDLTTSKGRTESQQIIPASPPAQNCSILPASSLPPPTSRMASYSTTYTPNPWPSLHQ